MKNLILLFLIFTNSFGYSQTNSKPNRAELDDQIKEIMKAREEMIKSIFNDSNFQNFDSHFEDMVKKFQQRDFNLPEGVEGPVIGEYDWRETDTHLNFVLKVKQIKDKPLDIKIEKGQIILKGDVESVSENKKSKKITKVHFERAFSIPEGVDSTTPEFDNRDGELLIKFKKIKATHSLPKKQKSSIDSDERLPVSKDDNDIKI